MQLVKIMVGISTNGSILHASGKCAVSIEWWYAFTNHSQHHCCLSVLCIARKGSTLLNFCTSLVTDLVIQYTYISAVCGKPTQQTSFNILHV